LCLSLYVCVSQCYYVSLCVCIVSVSVCVSPSVCVCVCELLYVCVTHCMKWNHSLWRGVGDVLRCVSREKNKNRSRNPQQGRFMKLQGL